MLLTNSSNQNNLNRFYTRNDSDILRTHCDRAKNVNSSTTLRKKTRSTHCQIKTQSHVWSKNMGKCLICLTHKCTHTCEMLTYVWCWMNVYTNMHKNTFLVFNECQTQFLPVWFKNKTKKLWRLCNAFKDGNLTGGMRNIAIICFSPLAVSHTEKCLMTTDYAKKKMFLLICFAICSLDDVCSWVKITPLF